METYIAKQVISNKMSEVFGSGESTTNSLGNIFGGGGASAAESGNNNNSTGDNIRSSSSPNLFSSSSSADNNNNNNNNNSNNNNNNSEMKFDLEMLNHTRERLFSVLESQAGIMSFILYVIFSFIVTGSVDWTVSFGCFALATRMVIHAVVVIMAFRHSDLLVSLIGIILIAVCLPLASDTAAAGIWAYLLLVLPFYAEQALKNQAVKEAMENSGAKFGLYRKRATQIVQLFSPIAVGIYPFFSLRGGFFFHFFYFIIALVYIASYFLRAMEMKKLNDNIYVNGNNGNNNNGTDQQQQQQGVQVLDGGIVISPSRNNVDRIHDSASVFVEDLQERRLKIESNISQKYPQVYTYYVHLPKVYTAALCTFVIFLLLVINVSTYTPDIVERQTNTSSSAASSAPVSLAPRNEGGAKDSSTKHTTATNEVYPDHFYISVGLVSAFLMASVELLSDAFLPNPKENNNEVDSTKSPKSNKNKNEEQKTPQDGGGAIAVDVENANENNNNKNTNDEDDDEKCCEAPSFLQVVARDLRYRRFALLLFAFILSFLPVSLRVYPAALALASYVPWIVWRDSCGKFITTLFVAQNVNTNNNNEQGNLENTTAGVLATNEEEANRRQQQPANTIEDFINERVIADFFLPTIVTGLLLLLATGAEDKRPSHFLSFIAIAGHAAMAYFLYFSLKQSLGNTNNRNGDANRNDDEDNSAVPRF